MPFVTLRRSAGAQLLGIAFTTSLVFLLLSQIVLAQESILVTTTDSTLGVYDLATCTLQKSFPTTYFNSAITVGVNPRLAFLSGNNGFMTVVDLTIGKEIKRIYNVGGSGLTAITPDGKTLIVWDDFNATLDLIDIPSLTVTKRINLLPAMYLNNADAGGDVVLAGNKVFLMPVFTDYFFTPPQAGVVDLATFKVTAIPFKRVSYFAGWTGNAVLTPDGKYVAVIGDFEEQNGAVPELLLVDTSTYAITTKMLQVDPDAIVVNPNHSDPTKYFGYLTFYDGNTGNPAVAAVDFRANSPTYGQMLPATEVQLINLGRFDVWGSGLGISSDGGKLAIGGDDSYDMYFNLMEVDTGLMFSDPMHAVVASKVIESGVATEGLTVATVNLTPPNSAPTVSGEQGNVTNDKDTEITISGTNFLDGALVRIGKLPPLDATVDNASSLRVTVPANVPSGPAADIVVTNPEPNGGLDQQYQSGALQGGLDIGLNPAFQPQEQFAFLSGKNYSSVGLFDLKQRQVKTLTAAPQSALNGIAFSSGGAELFGAGYITLTAWDTATGQQRGNQLALGGNSGSRLPIISENSPITGKPVIYVTVATYSRPYNIVLKIVDADRNSPNFNTVIGQISTGQNFGNPRTLSSEVATPDGKYVYVPYYYYDSNSNTQSHLAIFDVVNSTATIFDVDKFLISGTNQFQSTITADGRYLILHGSQFSSPFDTQLDVLDIATNPKKPQLVGAVAVPKIWKNGIYAPDLFSYRIAGNHLFAISHFSNSLMVFNFNPGNNDYRPYRLYKLPGNSNYQSTTMAVSPDGAYLYLGSNADSKILVLSTDRLTHNQDPLITTVASLDTTVTVAVSPVPPPPVSFKTHQHAQASARH